MNYAELLQYNEHNEVKQYDKYINRQKVIKYNNTYNYVSKNSKRKPSRMNKSDIQTLKKPKIYDYNKRMKDDSHYVNTMLNNIIKKHSYIKNDLHLIMTTPPIMISSLTNDDMKSQFPPDEYPKYMFYNKKGLSYMVPSMVISDIKHFLPLSHRYIAFFIYILSYYQTSENILCHANLLIIDKKYKVIERFEPHGKISRIEVINHTYESMNVLIEKTIQKLCHNLFNDYKYISPQEYSPEIGLQGIADLMTSIFDRNRFKEQIGYCVIWCLYYVIKRIKFDNCKKAMSHIIKPELSNKFLSVMKGDDVMTAHDYKLLKMYQWIPRIFISRYL